jgi:hypothetical protein
VEYVEKRPQASTPEARRGSEVHDCVAEYVKHLVANGLQTDLDFIRSLGISAEAREILETFATSHMFPEGTYLVEKKHEIPLSDSIIFSGVIDLAESRDLDVVITDYKTFWRTLSQVEVENNLQMKGYALLTSSLFPEADRFLCEMDFVRLGVTRSVTYNREDLTEIVSELLRRIEQIENDETLEARPGGSCDWCAGKRDCPALTTGIEAISSREDAEALADELIVLKARDKEIQALLKPYTTREGPIARNGMLVGYHTSHSASYKTLDLMAVLEERGYDPFAYLRPDTTGVKKIAGKDEALAADLAEISIDNSSSKFGIRKGGDAS